MNNNYNKNKRVEVLGNMKVSELAEQVGCHVTVIYDYIYGKLTDRSRYAAKIEEILGVDPSDTRIVTSDRSKKLNGMTVSEVAKGANCHEGAVYSYLNGSLSDRGITKHKIEVLLGIKTTEDILN